MKNSIRDIFRVKKSDDFPHVDESASVRDALMAFKHFDSGAVLVMREKKLVGIYSQTDFSRSSLYLSEESLLSSKVADAMTRDIVYVNRHYLLSDCLDVMIKMNISFLPVIEDQQPIALLSMKHLMEILIEDQEFMINQLIQYVSNSCVQERYAPQRAPVKMHTVG